MNKIGFCAKCSNAITKREKDSQGISALALLGCKKLSKTKWKKGLPTSIDEMFCQKNCPLIH